MNDVYLSVSERIRRAVNEYGEPIRVEELAALIGVSKTDINSRMSQIVRRGGVKRVGHGVYAPVGSKKTLAEVAKIEPQEKTPRPTSSPRGHNVQGTRTVSLLLEVIARADDPKPYAGVLREISDTLATV